MAKVFGELNITMKDLVFSDEETAPKAKNEKWQIQNVALRLSEKIRKRVYIPRTQSTRCNITPEKDGFTVTVTQDGIFPIRSYWLVIDFLYNYYNISSECSMSMTENVVKIKAPIKAGVSLAELKKKMEYSCQAHPTEIKELVLKRADTKNPAKRCIISCINDGNVKYMRVIPISRGKKIPCLSYEEFFGTAAKYFRDKEFTISCTMERARSFADVYLGDGYHSFIEKSTKEEIFALDNQVCDICHKSHNSAIEVVERQEVCEKCSGEVDALSKYVQIVRLQSKINRKTVSLIEKQKAMIEEQNARIQRLESEKEEKSAKEEPQCASVKKQTTSKKQTASDKKSVKNPKKKKS